MTGSLPERLTAESVNLAPLFPAVNQISSPSIDQARPREELNRLERIFRLPEVSTTAMNPAESSWSG
jgi:hypothetical protein